jgi:hypothetical protein
MKLATERSEHGAHVVILQLGFEANRCRQTDTQAGITVLFAGDG